MRVVHQLELQWRSLEAHLDIRQFRATTSHLRRNGESTRWSTCFNIDGNMIDTRGCTCESHISLQASVPGLHIDFSGLKRHLNSPIVEYICYFVCVAYLLVRRFDISGIAKQDGDGSLVATAPESKKKILTVNALPVIKSPAGPNAIQQAPRTMARTAMIRSLLVFCFCVAAEVEPSPPPVMIVNALLVVGSMTSRLASRLCLLRSGSNSQPPGTI